MRIRFAGSLAAVAVFAMAAPIWAGPRTDSTELSVTETTTVAGTQLERGTYQLKAVENGNQLKIQKDGKVIAEVPCHWIQLPQKANQTQVITDNNKVTEIDFNGKTDAVRLD